MTYFKKCHVSPKPDLNLGPKQQYSQFEFEISVSKSTQPPWLDLFDQINDRPYFNRKLNQFLHSAPQKKVIRLFLQVHVMGRSQCRRPFIKTLKPLCLNHSNLDSQNTAKRKAPSHSLSLSHTHTLAFPLLSFSLSLSLSRTLFMFPSLFLQHNFLGPYFSISPTHTLPTSPLCLTLLSHSFSIYFLFFLSLYFSFYFHFVSK